MPYHSYTCIDIDIDIDFYSLYDKTKKKTKREKNRRRNLPIEIFPNKSFASHKHISSPVKIKIVFYFTVEMLNIDWILVMN